jgi:cell wall-associated NlpC family hydrolase
MPEVTRAQVATAARGLIDTPFHHQGRLPGVGVDCAGVVIVVMRQLELSAPDFDVTGYPRAPDGTSLRAYCDEHMIAIEAADMQAGDVILVSWQGGDPQHLGILADHQNDGLSLVHAESRRYKRVIEQRIAFGRNMRLVQAYRIPGVT